MVGTVQRLSLLSARPRPGHAPGPAVRLPGILTGIAVVILTSLALPTLPAGAQSREEREAIPGNYTIGLYADRTGRSRQVELDKDQTHFEAFLGVTGDSTRAFSAMVFRLDLPLDVQLDGPIRWTALQGLTQKDNALQNGAQVEFNQECLQQTGEAPAIIGRLTFEVAPHVRETVIEPMPHKRWGLSVELCSDEQGWPKPYAEALPLVVKRRLSLWDRITDWFD